MAGPLLRFEVEGLAELSDGLGDAKRSLARAQRASNKTVAVAAQGWARAAAASSGNRRQAAMAGAIQARSTDLVARLAISRAKKWGAAGPAFWGQKRRFGWYGGWYKKQLDPQRAAGFAGGRPQGPAWVGASWQPGVAGEGPYAINDALAAHVEEIGVLYSVGYEAALRAAFPGGFER